MRNLDWRRDTAERAESEHIAALVASSVAEARLRAAVRGLALVIHRAAGEHIEDVRTGRVVLSVVEICDQKAASHIATVRWLRSNLPSVPVLAYCAASPGSSEAILEVVRAGATGLLLRDVDDATHRLREVIGEIRRAAIGDHVYDEVAPYVGEGARAFLRYAIDHSGMRISVESAAADLGVDRGTLADRLSRAHAPSPHKFLMWIRLAVAAEMLSDPGRSAQQVALELDFPSGTALRNILDRYAEITTGELKVRGPRAVLDKLKLALSVEPGAVARREDHRAVYQDAAMRVNG